MSDIIVIGGGAGGLLAAVAAAESGACVTVLEKNPECGKKILATGNGRCNFTNKVMDETCFHSDDPKRVMSIIDSFGNSELVAFMESVGVAVTEKNGWYYPRSLSAESVQKALIRRASHLGVRLKGSKTVTGIRMPGDHFDVMVGNYAYNADRVILAAGGLAAPVTGSTGDGLSFLGKMGVSVKKPLPALVPLIIQDNPLKSASGVRCEAALTLLVNGEEKDRTSGNLQITEYGISGIPVFQISSQAVRTIDNGDEVEVMVDFLPESDDTGHENRFIRNAMINLNDSDPDYQAYMGLFPKKLARIVYDSDYRHFRLKVSGYRGFDQAQTTSGGVTFDEINGDMSLKKIPGLYVCGELCDVDGICGGYNLQWACSSGHLAGIKASLNVTDLL